MVLIKAFIAVIVIGIMGVLTMLFWKSINNV